MASASKHIDPVAQRTLRRPISCAGIGLHSGRRVDVTLHPGDVNSGIVFIRTDVSQEPEIAARWHNVSDTRLCTVLANDSGISVGTVEHLLAALNGCAVDNAVIEVNAPELPIFDGSAEPWVDIIHRAGLVRQAAKRRAIRLHKPVMVQDEDKFAILSPATTSRFTVDIDFPSAAIGCQHCSMEMIDGEFGRGIAAARTFGFLHEVEYLRQQGLARGGSLENAIVVDGDVVLNQEGLRFQDEFVRHKLLDSIGDLYLAGVPIIAHYHSYKPGHKLNNDLLHALFAQPHAWSYVDFGKTHAEPALWGDERIAVSA